VLPGCCCICLWNRVLLIRLPLLPLKGWMLPPLQHEVGGTPQGLTLPCCYCPACRVLKTREEAAAVHQTSRCRLASAKV